ncbi:MAG: signal peptidase I [Verrucomicrobiota bacterium]
MYMFRWLGSRQVRRGAEMLGVVRKHYHHQRDLLAPAARAALEQALAEGGRAVRSAPRGEPLRAALAALEDSAHKWLRPYPHGAYRENFESLLGTAVLVFAFKTFFATPMEIPTGSAQPTFNGITYEDLRDRTGQPLPGTVERFWRRWGLGERYYEIIAQADGELQSISEPRKQVALGNIGFGRQCDVTVGGVRYPVSWAPESPARQLALVDEHTGRPSKAFFRKGEPIVRCVVRSGDRLFVERVVYNFRRPRRGEYFVFQSTGLPSPVTQGTHYIKRLVGLGGERIRVGDDRHLYVDGRRLTAEDSGFVRVLGFDPTQPPRADQYSGYVNDRVWKQFGWRPPGASESPYSIAPKFPDGDAEFVVRPRHYLGFGDNTMNSSDGRAWGDLPQEKVIGKALMVMWPFTRRWGF